MTIWNLGSINADHIFSVPRLPGPGETLAASGMARFLGGKGANLSVAAARAAAHVRHIGAIGADGRWMLERLLEYGVDTRAITEVDQPSGQAVVCVDPGGENQIVILPGANLTIDDAQIVDALSGARSDDIAVMQNETSGQVQMAQRARKLGLRVCYAAAPFDVDAVRAVLPMLDLLVMNAVEAEQLRAATGQGPENLGVGDVIVTLGAKGCRWFSPAGTQDFSAIPVTPVDTTGAGDTFTGYLLAGLDRGQPMAQAIGMANRAAALMVTRQGTADAIPDLHEIQESFGAGI